MLAAAAVTGGLVLFCFFFESTVTRYSVQSDLSWSDDEAFLVVRLLRSRPGDLSTAQ